jgi:hypothetical protein
MKKKNGMSIMCCHCGGDGCWHCEDSGEQWLYSGGSIARCYTGFLDGRLSRYDCAALYKSMTRKLRRAQSSEKRKYERRRKRFDRLVEPQGPKPQKKQRALSSFPTPVEQPITVSDDEPLIVDIHHDDKQTKVLYELDEIYGEFNFRDTILDQLDTYFIYLDRMRKHDADAWNLYRQIGALLMPYWASPDISQDLFSERMEKDTVDETIMSDWFMKILPAFGCIAYGANEYTEGIEKKKRTKTHDMWIPKFLYFTKYKNAPPEVQPMSGGTVYVITIWYDKPGDTKMKKGGIPQQIGMFVHHSGRMTVLKTLKTRFVRSRVNSKKSGIPQRNWKIQREFLKWARSRKQSVESLLGGIFRTAAEKIERSAHTTIRVSASKGGRFALFNVDHEIMPYFFQDRDFILTPSGFRKPIFHSVRAHMRRNGSAVRLHFRGQRDFKWAGHKILITVPGIHHKPVEEISIGCDDAKWRNEKEDMIGAEKVGQMIRERIEKGA